MLMMFLNHGCLLQNGFTPKVFRDSGRVGWASQCIIRQIPSPIVWVTSATKEGLIYFRDGKREDKVKSIKIFFYFSYIYIYTIHTTPNALNTLYTMYALYTRNAWLLWLANPGGHFEII